MLLGNLRGWRTLLPQGEFVPKPYHYAPLIRKIEQLLETSIARKPRTVPTLFVIRGADQGTRFELTESRTRLGRDASNALQLHDTEVSRLHAEIRRVDDDYVIADLGSSNGTFVNGQRIRNIPWPAATRFSSAAR